MQIKRVPGALRLQADAGRGDHGASRANRGRHLLGRASRNSSRSRSVGRSPTAAAAAAAGAAARVTTAIVVMEQATQTAEQRPVVISARSPHESQAGAAQQPGQGAGGLRRAWRRANRLAHRSTAARGPSTTAGRAGYRHSNCRDGTGRAGRQTDGSSDASHDRRTSHSVRRRSRRSRHSRGDSSRSKRPPEPLSGAAGAGSAPARAAEVASESNVHDQASIYGLSSAQGPWLRST